MNSAECNQYVKCPACGWVHISISDSQARARTDAYNTFLTDTGSPDSHASFERLLVCSGCGASTSGFLPAVESDAPVGSAIPTCVVERPRAS